MAGRDVGLDFRPNLWSTFMAVTMREMLEAGVHFGHQTRFWNPKMAPYIFGHRNKIHIINLEKSLPMLQEATKFAQQLTANRGTVLFVGTKRQARDTIAAEAQRAGVPFVNQRWLGGMLTNFKTVKTSIKRLKDMKAQQEAGLESLSTAPSTTTTTAAQASSPIELGKKKHACRREATAAPAMAAFPRRGRPPGSLLVVLVLLAMAAVLPRGEALELKVPFSPRDVLPVLPRQVAWPLMNTLHSAVDLLPSYVAAVAPGAPSPATWPGVCFSQNEAAIELTPGDRKGNGTDVGGAVVRLKTASAHSWTCMDLYVFATPYRITWDYYFSAREHTLEIKSWEEEAELEYVKQHGISIFLMPSGMLGTLLSLIDVLPLFSNTAWGQHSNLAFLEKHMGASFEKRSQPWVANFRKEDVQSGDFLALSKIRGRWGAFETLEKWVTGAFAGHTSVCLKDEKGDLWVAESGYENEKGEEVIAIVPWDEWWAAALKDESNPQIALLPLHPDVRAKFNESAAWDFAQSMAGKPYGYHNMIFSWIDTIGDNYPPPLDANLVMAVMSMWTRVQPLYAANMWNEALNKRLGTEGLDLQGIIVETERRGMSFDQLLTIPEQDEWVYSDGKSTTCVAFILAMYKEAGVFAPFSESIQVTEFTIRDAYMLKIFEDNQTRLPSWCNTESDKLPFCQILGEYKMELPEYNTIEPYSKMNENCPSLPPKYMRPLRC